MALEFKTIQPMEYFRRFLKLNRRPDQRGLWESREMKIDIGSISTADSSSVVKLGNTCVVCGIKGELVAPKVDKPKEGHIVPNVEFSSICSSSFRPGPPNDKSQITSQLVSNIITDSQCLNLEDLCILESKLVWVLYCDILCLEYDGNPVDSAVLSLFSALKNLTLPSVTIKPDGNITINNTLKRKSISLRSFPITTTYAMIDNYIIMDPTNEEENLSQGSLTVAVLEDKTFCLFKKTGGGLLDSCKRDSCLKHAQDHAVQVYNLVNKCKKAN